MDKIRLVAEPGSLVTKCHASKVNITSELNDRLKLLENFDFGFLLLGLSPRRLLRDGRLFDNEQVLPMLLYFAQWDKHCRFWASEIMRQWLVFNPSQGEFESIVDDKAVEFRDYFYEKYAIPLIEEFRMFVALCMLYPNEHNAPSGPVDMIWHSFILNTEEYWEFGRIIWIGAPHMPPEVPEEQIWAKENTLSI
ncbi:hypothetical protein [Prochlorococcus marinus]|uniref:hypothetical protein n=1 Tax=Prochlorococcus TaxID=1218 RepID=UPI0007B3E630|nr:hypothetical protein [Prochlorococcus marinus]KZR75469.1 hypothetical protein PMIT1323_01760 [Prochlorococcus marinus str. MIT 1323]